MNVRTFNNQARAALGTLNYRCSTWGLDGKKIRASDRELVPGLVPGVPFMVARSFKSKKGNPLIYWAGFTISPI